MRGHLLALASFCSLAGTVMAATDDKVTFESLDGDRDGFVSRGEVPADHPLARDFTTYDTDSDRQLSKAEFDAFESSTQEPREEF